MARDNLEANPITIKPKTASHVAEQSSWVPSPSCSPPGHLFSIRSLGLSAHVSPWTIHFQVLDKSPLSGPGRGPPSCNSWKRKPLHHCLAASSLSSRHPTSLSSSFFLLRSAQGRAADLKHVQTNNGGKKINEATEWGNVTAFSM